MKGLRPLSLSLLVLALAAPLSAATPATSTTQPAVVAASPAVPAVASPAAELPLFLAASPAELGPLGIACPEIPTGLLRVPVQRVLLHLHSTRSRLPGAASLLASPAHGTVLRRGGPHPPIAGSGAANVS